jgi:hypothetical protein
MVDALKKCTALESFEVDADQAAIDNKIGRPPANMVIGSWVCYHVSTNAYINIYIYYLSSNIRIIDD